MSLENGAAPAATPTPATPAAQASELQPGAQAPADGGAAEPAEGAQPTAGQPQQPEGQTEEQANKKRERFDKRFSELSKAAREAERDAAYWRGVAEASRNGQRAAGEQPAPQPAKPAGPPDPAKYPQGKYDPDYTVDLAEYRVELKLKAEREANANAERERADNAAIEEGRERLEETLNAAQAAADGEHGQYFENAPAFLEDAARRLPRATVDLITKSQYSVHLAEVLGRDPDSVQHLKAMRPIDAALYIGDLTAQIRSRVKPANAQAPAAKPAPTPSPAALPTAPAGGGVAPFNAERASFEEFQAYARKVREANARANGAD